MRSLSFRFRVAFCSRCGHDIVPAGFQQSISTGSASACRTRVCRPKSSRSRAITATPARPITRGRRAPARCPGIVVIMHLPGWDEWIIEVARKFAHHGYAAISPHLYFREGPGSPDDIGARVRAAGGVADAQVVGDVAGAVAYLRAQPNSNGKVGVIGFCSGGRHAYLVGLQRCPASTRWSTAGAATSWSTIRRRQLDATQAGRADRPDREADGAADRHLRQRRRQPEPRARQQDRGGAQEARQELRVPPLRRLRPRLLQLGAAGVPARAGGRRLGQGVRVPEEAHRMMHCRRPGCGSSPPLDSRESRRSTNLRLASARWVPRLREDERKVRQAGSKQQ